MKNRKKNLFLISKNEKSFARLQSGCSHSKLSYNKRIKNIKWQMIGLRLSQTGSKQLLLGNSFSFYFRLVIINMAHLNVFRSLRVERKLFFVGFVFKLMKLYLLALAPFLSARFSQLMISRSARHSD